MAWHIAKSQVPFVCEGQLFVTLEEEPNQRLIRIEIDPFTQQIQFVPIRDDVNGIINGIGYRITDNLIYGINPLSRNQNGHYLERLDATGNLELLKELNLNDDFGYFAGDVTPDGNFLILIGVDIKNRTFSDFVKVDLRTSNYPVQISKMNASYNIFDIAFDPLTGQLYAYESIQGNLMILDPDDGGVIQQIKTNSIVDEIAGLFFDAFGQLYGYGGTTQNNTLLKINKTSGQITKLISGPAVNNADATACPFTIEMIKTVTPEITVPCREVEYTFSIANGSGEVQTALIFEDKLPADFIIKEIIRNPYIGEVFINAQNNQITIENMAIPPGVDSIKILVDVGASVNGVYKNQAILKNLAVELGTFRVSDNPKTLEKNDSTMIEIIGSPVPDTLDVYHHLCLGESIVLDGTIYGDRYLWSTGSTAPTLQINTEGVYTLLGERDCDKNIIRYQVISDYISVDLPQEPISIRLGDRYFAQPVFVNSQEFFTTRWQVDDTTEVQCIHCLNTNIRPLTHDIFKLIVSNAAGCVDSALIQFRIDRTRRVYLPNVFTPNDDGSNDYFFAQSPDEGVIHKMLIFNRWGDLVYDAKGTALLNHPKTGWDGSLNGRPLDPSVYTYLFEIEYLDGVRDIISGDITLLR